MSEVTAHVWCPCCGDAVVWGYDHGGAEEPMWICWKCSLFAKPETWATLMRSSLNDEHDVIPMARHTLADIELARRGGDS
jgi:hypothetical protein